MADESSDGPAREGIAEAIDRMLLRREIRSRVRDMVSSLSLEDEIRSKVAEMVDKVSFKHEIRAVLDDAIQAVEDKAIKALVAEDALVEARLEAQRKRAEHQRLSALKQAARVQAELEAKQRDERERTLGEHSIHDMVTKVFEDVIVAAGVHDMVSAVFQRVVHEHKDIDPEGVIPKMIGQVFKSVVRAAIERDKEAERRAKLALLPHPLVHFMVLRVIRKVIELATGEAGVTWNIEQQRRLVLQDRDLAAVQDIVRLCKERYCHLGRELPPFLDILAYFQLRAALLQFSERTEEDTIGSDILELCVHHLAQQDCPAQETIRLQVSAQVPLHQELRPLIEKDLDERHALEGILQDVSEIQVEDMRQTYEMVEALHSRLLDYVLVASRQIEGNPAESSDAEARAAFESIYTRASCLFWMDLPREEKLLQVPEMAAVVTGIRAFNKSRGQGGKSFELPFERYKVEISLLGERVMNCLETVDGKVQRCAQAISLHLGTLGVRHVLIQRLRDELAYYMQAFALLQSLESYLTERFDIVAEYDNRCSQHLKILYDTIGSKKVIANEMVFPSFQAVGMLTKSISDELRLLRAYVRALGPFLSLVSEPLFTCTPSGIANLDTARGLTKLQVLIDYSAWLDPEVYSVEWQENDMILNDEDTEERLECIVYCPDGTKDAMDAGAFLQCGGYCPVMLAKHRGLLVKGSTEHGLVRVDGKFYVVSSEQARKEFSTWPTRYLEAIDNVVRKMPQLVHILGLENTPPYSSVNISKLIDSLKKPVPCDFAAQTCHQQAYRSVLYAAETLRRRLFNKETTSAQTDRSYYKRSSFAQVFQLKEKFTQTPRSQGSNATLRRVQNVTYQSSYALDNRC